MLKKINNKKLKKNILYVIGSVLIIFSIIITLLYIYYANSHFQWQMLKQKQIIQELYSDIAIRIGEEESLRLTSTLTEDEKEIHNKIMHDTELAIMCIYRVEDYEYATNLIDDALGEYLKLNEDFSSKDTLSSDSLNLIDSIENIKEKIEEEEKILNNQKNNYNKFYKNFEIVLKFVEHVKKFF